jgi:hypothetical protein
MSAAANIASNAPLNVAVAVADDDRNRWACSSRSISRLRAAWVTQTPVRCGDAGQVDSPVAEFDHEQDVQPGQPDRLDGEEVAGECAGGCVGAVSTLGPPRRGAGPRWRRCRMMRTDVAETGTSSLWRWCNDAYVSPARVFPGQTKHQVDHMRVQPLRRRPFG